MFTSSGVPPFSSVYQLIVIPLVGFKTARLATVAEKQNVCIGLTIGDVGVVLTFSVLLAEEVVHT